MNIQVKVNIQNIKYTNLKKLFYFFKENNQKLVIEIFFWKIYSTLLSYKPNN